MCEAACVPAAPPVALQDVLLPRNSLLQPGALMCLLQSLQSMGDLAATKRIGIKQSLQDLRAELQRLHQAIPQVGAREARSL